MKDRIINSLADICKEKFNIDNINISLQIPKDKKHGNFTSNIALILKPKLNRDAIEIANEIKGLLDFDNLNILDVEVVQPGFINIFLSKSNINSEIRSLLDKGPSYLYTNVGDRKTVNVEYISANPTGRLHLGHARNAIYGNSIVRLLKKQNFDVTSEYYLNDYGNQIFELAKSTYFSYMKLLNLEIGSVSKNWDKDESGEYKIAYLSPDVDDVAKELVEKHGDKLNNFNEQDIIIFKEASKTHMLSLIKDTLSELDISFDKWTSETKLFESNLIQQTLDFLKGKNLIYDKDGATWFKSSKFGDDKDRVLVKADKTYTYLVGDIANHYQKIHNNYEILINVWGSDHHGYVPRIRAIVENLEFNLDNFHIPLIQLVKLIKGNEVVKMSKRARNVVLIDDLIEEVDKNTVKYFFLEKESNTPIAFDLELAKKNSSDNPIYYIQYAYARINALYKKLNEGQINLIKDIDISKHLNDDELQLTNIILKYREVLVSATKDYSIHKLCNYAYTLANEFHKFYNSRRFIDAEKIELTSSYFVLIDSFKVILNDLLDIFGIIPMEEM